MSEKACDYEAYAKLSPNFFAEDAFPKPIVAALAGRKGTFIDVGTGDGSKLRALHQLGHLTSFDRILATDLSQTRVERVKRIIPNVSAFVANAQQIDLPAESIDFYYSDQVIEHVPDDSKMAEDAFRLLSPGGCAFIGSVIKKRFAWYYYRSNGKWVIDPTHLREYASADDYAAVFERAGFQVSRIITEPLVVPASDQFVRVLVRLNVLRADFLSGLYDSRFLKLMRNVRIRIPGYYMVYAILTKPTGKRSPRAGSL